MRALLCVTVLALAGCSRSSPPPTAEAKAPPATSADTVTLNEAAQRGAGIRVEPAAERSMPEVVRANARLTNDEERTWRVGAITHPIPSCAPSSAAWPEELGPAPTTS